MENHWWGPRVRKHSVGRRMRKGRRKETWEVRRRGEEGSKGLKREEREGERGKKGEKKGLEQ